jgi:hypothetical protein
VFSPFYSFLGFIRPSSPYDSVSECSTRATHMFRQAIHMFRQATYRSCWPTASLFAFDLPFSRVWLMRLLVGSIPGFLYLSLIMNIYSSLPFYFLFSIHT